MHHHHPYTATRNTSTSMAYEYSDDMRARTLGVLEQRYGGRVRANRAATIIQRAYRRYQMDVTW
jgi:hypothetical protein